jgi:hypothetical protein
LKRTGQTPNEFDGPAQTRRSRERRFVGRHKERQIGGPRERPAALRRPPRQEAKVDHSRVKRRSAACSCSCQQPRLQTGGVDCASRRSDFAGLEVRLARSSPPASTCPSAFGPSALLLRVSPLFSLLLRFRGIIAEILGSLARV